MDDPEKRDPVTPCMGVFKSKIQSERSLGKLKLMIVVKEYLQNKEMIGDTWDPTSSMINMKYFLAYDSKNYIIVY